MAERKIAKFMEDPSFHTSPSIPHGDRNMVKPIVESLAFVTQDATHSYRII
jgi:hypothetical protein